MKELMLVNQIGCFCLVIWTVMACVVFGVRGGGLQACEAKLACPPKHQRRWDTAFK